MFVKGRVYFNMILTFNIRRCSQIMFVVHFAVVQWWSEAVGSLNARTSDRSCPDNSCFGDKGTKGFKITKKGKECSQRDKRLRGNRSFLRKNGVDVPIPAQATTWPRNIHFLVEGMYNSRAWGWVHRHPAFSVDFQSRRWKTSINVAHWSILVFVAKIRKSFNVACSSRILRTRPCGILACRGRPLSLRAKLDGRRPSIIAPWARSGLWYRQQLVQWRIWYTFDWATNTNNCKPVESQLFLHDSLQNKSFHCTSRHHDYWKLSFAHHVHVFDIFVVDVVSKT